MAKCYDIKRREYCGQADGACLNPAGYATGGGHADNSEGPRTTAECVECGKVVCANCSLPRGRRRVCNDCLEKEGYQFNHSTGKMELPQAPPVDISALLRLLGPANDTGITEVDRLQTAIADVLLVLKEGPQNRLLDGKAKAHLNWLWGIYSKFPWADLARAAREAGNGRH